MRRSTSGRDNLRATGEIVPFDSDAGATRQVLHAPRHSCGGFAFEIGNGAVPRQRSRPAPAAHRPAMWRTAVRPTGAGIDTGSSPRLLAIVSTAPSPSRQRARTAFAPIARASIEQRSIEPRHDLGLPQRDQSPIQRLRAVAGFRIGMRNGRLERSQRVRDPGCVRASPDRRMPESGRIHSGVPRAPPRPVLR